MTRGAKTVAALAVAAMVAALPVTASAQTQTVPNPGGGDQAQGQPPGLSDSEKQGVGCLVGGSALFAAATLAGPSEAIMLYGGGLLVPSGSFVLWYALIGTLASAGCGIGAVVTPTVLWTVDQWDNLTGRGAQELARLGQKMAGEVEPGTSTAAVARLPKGSAAPAQ